MSIISKPLSILEQKKLYLNGEYCILELLTICRDILVRSNNNHNVQLYWNDEGEVNLSNYIENPDTQIDAVIDFD